MCIYTVKKQKFKKNEIPPKLDVSGVRDTAKINKDVGLACYILVLLTM